MSGMSWTLGGAQVENLSYSYDADGRVTALGGSLAAVNLPASASGDAFNADNGMTGFNGAALISVPIQRMALILRRWSSSSGV